MIACNNSSDTELKDPSVVHPLSEAILDSTRLVNDSVIVATQSEVMVARLAKVILYKRVDTNN
jgi:hypothetical protein